jgi:hypothetical protein
MMVEVPESAPSNPSFGLHEPDLRADQIGGTRRLLIKAFFARPMRCASRFTAIEHKGHRPVVQQLNLHMRGKDSCLYMSTLGSQPLRNLLV